MREYKLEGLDVRVHEYGLTMKRNREIEDLVFASRYRCEQVRGDLELSWCDMWLLGVNLKVLKMGLWLRSTDLVVAAIRGAHFILLLYYTVRDMLNPTTWVEKIGEKTNESLARDIALLFLLFIWISLVTLHGLLTLPIDMVIKYGINRR